MPNKPEAVWCVIPAAGGGSRMGGRVPKQYLDLGGCSVLERSARVFHGMDEVSAVAVGLAPDDALWQSTGLDGLRGIHTFTGGEERVHTVLAGLRFLSESLGAAPPDWVLVHDAARPLVRAADVRTLLTQCRDSDRGGLLVAEMVDTVKRGDGAGCVEETLDRAALWRALTPQCFRLGELEAAIVSAVGNGAITTDESDAMERAGHAVRMVPGDGNNLKITRPADIRLARCLISS